MDRRGRELRYLTEHYRDLQGLVQAPVWAYIALIGVWANAWTGLSGTLLWLKWLVVIVLGLALAKWPLWTRDWYERRYGVVWTADEEDGGVEMISLLDGEAEKVRERRRKRRQRRFLIVGAVAAVFFLPAAWLHGEGNLQLTSWVGFCYVFAWPPLLYLGPMLLERAGSCALAMWRWGVYAAAVLVLLLGDLLFMAGRMKGTWTLAVVGGVMLVVSLQDHWLFTRLLGGGAKAGGGCDE
jgi:hypothetical protein